MPNGKVGIIKETAVQSDVVQKIKSVLPDDKEIVALAETFKLFGDPTRLKILMGLAKRELCVCDIATLIGLTVSAVSHQLRLLRGMKLVKFRKMGKMVYYSLDDDHIEKIISITQVHVRE